MITKIVLIGLCVCVICSVLKAFNKSYIIFIEIAFLCFVSFLVLNDAIEAMKELNNIFEKTNVSNKLFICLFKGALICIVTRLASDISKESGNIIISDIIELSGRIMLIIIAMPFIKSVAEKALTFIV